MHEQLKLVSSSHIVRDSLPQFKDLCQKDEERKQQGLPESQRVRLIEVEDIPGVKQAGFNKEEYYKQVELIRQRQATLPPPGSDIQPKLNSILKILSGNKAIWPFAKPVDATLVRDYYLVIKNPMDIQTVTNKLSNNEYKTKEMFYRDIMLIITNCQTYNAADSVYVQCSKTIHKVFEEAFEQQFPGELVNMPGQQQNGNTQNGQNTQTNSNSNNSNESSSTSSSANYGQPVSSPSNNINITENDVLQSIITKAEPEN